MATDLRPETRQQLLDASTMPYSAAAIVMTPAEARAILAAMEPAMEREQEAIEALERIEAWSRAYPLDVFPGGRPPMPDPDAPERTDLIARLRKEASDCRQFVYEFQDDEGRVSVRAQTLMKTANAFDIAADALEARRTPRELVCMICDRQYPIWYAPNELWNAVERQSDGSDTHPFLCPTCFANRANAMGVGQVFRLSLDSRPKQQGSKEELPAHLRMIADCQTNGEFAEIVHEAADALEDLTARYRDAQSEADRLAIRPPNSSKISDSSAALEASPEPPVQEPVTEKPPVHVTEHGVSYVRVDELVQSRAFWGEVERTRRAIYAGEPELFEPEVGDG